jgi:hypothetical protein
MGDLVETIHRIIWWGGTALAVGIVVGIFAIAYPWQSDPWGLTRWF